MTVPLLSEPGEADRRLAMLPGSPVAPLLPFVAALRGRYGRVPNPDPLDGGSGARLLLLLETPGPSVGDFVSADSRTGTGRNLRRFCAEAGLRREDRLIWNAIPWVIHAPGSRNRAPRPAELRAGIAELPSLLPLLPRLRVAVLAGRSAAAAAALLPAGLPVLLMPHPSPTITCTSPAIPARIAAALAGAAAILRS